MLMALTACADDGPETSVAAMTAQPEAARFQSVREKGNHVCGEVNGKDSEGAYSGYRRFVYDRRTEAGLIDPGLSNAIATAAPGPGCGKPFAYQSVEERLECAEAPLRTADAERQRRFDTLWAKACA